MFTFFEENGFVQALDARIEEPVLKRSSLNLFSEAGARPPTSSSRSSLTAVNIGSETGKLDSGKKDSYGDDGIVMERKITFNVKREK